MFTITWRVTKRQIAAAAAVMVLAFAGGVWLKAAFAQTHNTPTRAAAQEEIKIEKAPGKTGEQRVEFLSSFGWQVDSAEEEILEVKIPKELDDVYDNYNKIQKAQGCDLTRYGGKRCKRYTYIVLNYPGAPENVRANIITYNGKIIGGDVCSIELDGFMHGFAPETD